MKINSKLTVIWSIIFVVAIVFSACSTATMGPTEVPVVSETPAATEVPVVSETPAVTETPAPTLAPDEDVIASLYDYNLSEHITLGQYKDIVVEIRDPSATNEEINEYLDELRNKFKETVPVEDRSVQEGDTVNIDYKGFIDGEAGDNMAANGQALVIGSNTFIPGFEDALIGAAIGETVTFDITFPEDYWSESMAGVKATFEVKINSISVVMLPELTDEFIAENTDYETLEAYKAYLSEKITKENQDEIDSNLLYEAWSIVVENATMIECPESLYKQLEETYNSQIVSAAEQYGMTFEQYLSYFGLTKEEYAKMLEEQVLNTAKATLVLYAVIAEEGIVITWAEYQELVKEYFEYVGVTTLEELEKKIPREDICGEIAYERVLEILEATTKTEIKK